MQGYHKALTVLLIVYIGIFCFLFFALPERSFSAAENRFLQTRPVLSRQKLLSGQFSQAAEKYLADQFVLRDSWIRLKACLNCCCKWIIAFTLAGTVICCKTAAPEKEQLEQNISAVVTLPNSREECLFFAGTCLSTDFAREITALCRSTNC